MQLRSEEVSALNQPKKIRFKYRIKYTKGPELRFVSHLDIMRVFQRAVKRAKLPIEYSHGFNPHQIMSFANPLSLGMTSIGEYCDVEFTTGVDTKEIKDRLNAVMNDGIDIVNVTKMAQDAGNAMASISACEYEIYFNELMDKETVGKYAEAFFNRKEIITMKKTKNNYKETDIRPDIFELKDISDDECGKLMVVLAAGSIRSLRADLVAENFCRFAGVEFNKYKVRYRRNDMYRELDGKLRPLDEEVDIR